MIPKIKGIVKLLSLPRPAKKILGILLRLLKQKQTANLVFEAFKPIDLPTLLAQHQEMKRQVISYLQERGIDVIVCPPYPTPALKHDGSADMSVEGVYAQLFNYLGFPAGSRLAFQSKDGRSRHA